MVNSQIAKNISVMLSLWKPCLLNPIFSLCSGHNLLVPLFMFNTLIIFYKDDAFTDVMNEMIDELSLGLCFEIHRSIKIGFHELVEKAEKWVSTLGYELSFLSCMQ